jgi:hypothetical protein
VSTLAGQRLSEVTVNVPRYGGCFGRATLESGPVPSGKVPLVIEDLTLLVSILPDRSGEDAPDKPGVAFASGVGWNAVSKARTWRSDVGVRLSTIVKDLASDAGETLLLSTLPSPDPVVGRWWGRAASSPGERWTHRHALAALLRAGYAPAWWIDGEGRTRFDARTSAAVTSRGTATKPHNLAAGVRYVAIDSALAFLPGGIFEGTAIDRLILRETPGHLTAELWAA